MTFLVVAGLLLGAATTDAFGAKGEAHKVSMIYLEEFHGTPEIWAVRPNGKELHMVALGSDAQISPDGKRVYCKCGKHGGIGMMKPDGSDLRTIGPGHRNFGSAYLYLSGVGTFVTSGGNSIFVGQDSAESFAALHTVYTAPEHEVGGYRSESSVEFPFFSPDGSKILFLEDEQTTQTSCGEHQSKGCRYIARVNVINSDGSGLHTVVETPLENRPLPENTMVRVGELIEGLAGFSADGNTVLLYYEEKATTGANVWTAASNGGLKRELDPLPHDGYGARLSENGEQIAFSSFANGSESRTLGVYTIGVDGSGLRKIAPAAADERVTSWGKVLVP